MGIETDKKLFTLLGSFAGYGNGDSNDRSTLWPTYNKQNGVARRNCAAPEQARPRGAWRKS